MARLIGPDFIALQVPDPEASAPFYETMLGLTRAPAGPPGAVVFQTRPIPFALRTPIGSLPSPEARGKGVALWMGCEDADALHAKLSEAGVSIATPAQDGPFGRFFTFSDPDGYAITTHTVRTAG